MREVVIVYLLHLPFRFPRWSEYESLIVDEATCEAKDKAWINDIF